MEAEYDPLADEYDATRESATQREVDALGLSFAGCRTILDVGVGTGRLAQPLSASGIEVTGIDASRMMLRKAGEKGLGLLVHGDAYSLPFAPKSFDGALIVHVLHVVSDWVSVMGEIGRVTRGPVVSLLRQTEVPGRLPSPDPPRSPEPQAEPFPQRRTRTQHRMRQNELELRARVPPVRLERIRDEVISIPIEEAMRSLQAKRPMGAQMMPPEVARQMLQRIVSASGGRSIQRRILEDIAVWRASDLEALRQKG